MADETKATPTWEACRAFLKVAMEAVEKQYKREIDDLRFQSAEHQWPDSVKAARAAKVYGNIHIPERPMLSIATLDEPIALVTAQERSAHLGVRVHALSEDASDETATVLQGLYRNIERVSRAHIARDWAFDRAVKCGRGCYRIVTEYDRDSPVPGDQKISIKRMLFQSSAYPDPFAQEPDHLDGEKLAIVEDLPFAKYKRLYPTSKLGKYTDGGLADLRVEYPEWCGGDTDDARTVRVAEYFYFTYAEQSTTATNRLGAQTTVTTQERTLHWCKVNAVEELESRTLDGKYIPWVPVLGRELQPFDRERHFIGLITNAKDGARLTNFAASAAVEMAALEPKAPWQGVEGVFQGHEQEYAESNIRNIPFLQHRPRDLEGNPAAAPLRVQVDVSRMGPSMELLRMGRDFVQVGTSTYDPALGKQPTAHRSGRAIVALQDQTVEGTSHYLDNLANISMPYEALVVLDSIPHVYDRPGRITQILDDNNVGSLVMLNHPFVIDPGTKRPRALPYGTPDEKAKADAYVADPQHPAKHYDLTKGRYGVSVTIGKSNASRLQEGSDQIGQLLQADPALMPIIGPEWMQFQDYPGAHAIGKILKKMRDHSFPWLSDDPTQNPAAQLASAQQTLQQMQQAMQEMQRKLDANEAKIQGDIAIASHKDTTALLKTQMDNETKLAVAELGAKVDRLSLFLEERARLGVQEHDAGQAALDRAHEVGMSRMDQTHALETGQQDLAGQAALADQGQQHTLKAGQQAADLAPVPASA